MAHHILIAEDSPTQAKHLEQLLIGEGYQVTVAYNGRDALAEVRQRPPDLVMTDVVMPEMDGYDLCHAINQDDTLKDIPVILLTQLTDLEDIIRGLHVGADYYLTKPFDGDFLLARIKSVIRTVELQSGKNGADGELEVDFGGRMHVFTSVPKQVLTLLLSTYEHTINQHRELLRTRRNLEVLNMQLEEKVQKRTAALLTEIVERKQAEADLVNLTNRYQLILNSAGEGILGFDIDGKHIFVNPAAARMLGYATDELIGQPGHTTWHHKKINGSDYPGAECLICAAYQSGMRYKSSNELFWRKDGSSFPADCKCTPAYVNKKIVGAVITFSDITDRVQADEEREKLLHDMEERVKELQCMYGVTNSIHRRETLDEIFQDVVNLIPPSWHYPEISRGKIVFDEKEYLSEPFVESEWKQSQDIIVNNEPRGIVEVYCLEECPELNDGPFFQEERDLINGIAKALGEMAEKKIAENEKREMEVHLRQGQKLESIGTLAGGVAHEINNPIMGIMNYAQLIGERLDPGQDQLSEFSAEIIYESKRVAEIVRNLLTFSRQEKQAHSPARMADIIDGTLSLIRTIIKRDQITLEVDVPDDLPKIKCRSQQIQQVLMNLLTNARDALNERYPEYDPDKIITVSAQLFEKEGQVWLRITIEDHGAGIPGKIRERIFDPFFTTKDRTKGTGLGLSISLGIVQDHQGELTFESVENQFTRFYLDLLVDNGWEFQHEQG